METSSTWQSPAAALPAAPVQPRTAIAPVWHTVLLILLQLALAFSGAANAGRARAAAHPNRIAIYAVTIVVQWITVAFIYYGLRRRGNSLRDLIGGKWNSAKDFFLDAGIAAAFWIGALFVLGLTAIALGIDRSHDAARFMAPQNAREIVLWITLSATAGFCEETIFRGYFQRQFLAWTGEPAIAIVLSALIFGVGHLYQNFKSAVVVTVFGIMFGILAWKRGNLRPGMMTHAWHDTFAGLVLRVLPK